MRRVLVLLAAGLAVVPAAASAAERSLLVNGDSLAEGTRPYGRSLPRVVHVSLGTNDDPSHTGAFRAAVGDVMDVAGDGRCVVWANVVRPRYGGVSYRGYNRVLAREDERRGNLLVLNWVRMVRRHPEWLADDGVHVSAAGYRARAKAVARLVRRCG
jgi:hypothetical protein